MITRYDILCLIVCNLVAMPGFCQAPLGVTAPGGGAAQDSLRIPSGMRVGSETATPARIRQLIAALGVGSTLYGSCTPMMSKGDLAAVELVKIGPPAVELLAQEVQDINSAGTGAGEAENRRWFAVQILGRIGDKRALSALDFCLRHEPAAFVRAAAPFSLEELKDNRAEDALLFGLKDSYPDIQASAAHALGTLRSVRSIGALIVLLGEPSRVPAVNRGAMLGPRALSPALSAALALGQIGMPAVQPLRSAITSTDARVHRFAAIGLANNQSHLADSDIRKLLRDTDTEIRLAATRGETQRRDPMAVPILAECLSDPSSEVRATAGRALAASGGLAGLKALIAVANGREPGAAANASEALRDLWDPKAADLLLEVVRNGKGRARVSAAESLLHFSEPRAVAPTLNLLSDADPAVREVAVWVVNQVKDARAFPALARATDDPAEKVRIAATELVSHRRADPIVPLLLRKLADPSEQVRLYAIYGLAIKGNRQAVGPLQRLIAQDSPRVQDAARKALQTIQGQ